MMKKIITLCIVALTTMSLTAQVVIDRPGYGPIPDVPKPSSFMMKYGIKAGLNMTAMSNEMSFDPKFSMGAGFRAGALLNMRWGQRTENSLPGTGVWGFQPEILYSYQNVKSEAGNITMNFISLPLLLKIYPTTSFSFEVGPEFSYMFLVSPEEMTVDHTKIKVGQCEGLNIGIAGGITYDFYNGFTIGARYTYGFNNMAKNLKWKNSSLQVTAGWMF